MKTINTPSVKSLDFNEAIQPFYRKIVKSIAWLVLILPILTACSTDKAANDATQKVAADAGYTLYCGKTLVQCTAAGFLNARCATATASSILETSNVVNCYAKGLAITNGIATIGTDGFSDSVNTQLQNQMTNLQRLSADQTIEQRLTALSSGLSITTGEAAIERANLSGDSSKLDQTKLSLANQSLDVGKPGAWVSLSKDFSHGGNNSNEVSQNIRVGQDFALNSNFTVGISASYVSSIQSKDNDYSSSMASRLVDTNLYGLYSQGRVRVSSLVGLQNGTKQSRMINSTSVQTQLNGANAEARIGYELGNLAVGKNLAVSFIPTLGLGYRTVSDRGNSDSIINDGSGVSIANLSQEQAYAVIGLTARSVIYWNDYAIMPKVSLGYEPGIFHSGQTSINGVTYNSTQVQQFSLKTQENFAVTKIGLGLDMIEVGEGVTMKADYKAYLSQKFNDQNFTLGIRLAF